MAGFMPPMTPLLDQVPVRGQRLLFSATSDRKVDLLAGRYLRDPLVHSVNPSARAGITLVHHLLHVYDASVRLTFRRCTRQRLHSVSSE